MGEQYFYHSPIIYIVFFKILYALATFSRTVVIAPSVNVRADSVTSAVRVIVIPFVLSAEPPAFEAAEASSPVLRPNAI